MASTLQGVLYVLAGVVAMLLWHDTTFYWSHRAMHHPKIFKHIHKTHHLSRDANVLTAVAFHPLEAIIESIWVYPLLFLIPIHPLSILLFFVIEGIHTVYGHSGYEMFPSWWTRHWFFKHKTAIATHHSMHHEKVNGNYGLYFTWWDKLMGTEFSDYESRFDAVVSNNKLNAEVVK